MGPDGFEGDDFETPCFPAGKKNPPVSIVYVPSHLYHMLFELFKVREKSFTNERSGRVGRSFIASFIDRML